MLGSLPSRQIRRRAGLLVLSLCLFCAFTSTSRAEVSPDMAEHMIICPAEFAPQFEVLATHRTVVADLPSCVVTLEDVLSSAPQGRDDAETLRNYLIQQHDLGHLQYVLLGGDSSVMPVRFARSTFYPQGGFSDIPSDLYFACLNGDWDADGDSIFGEAYLAYDDPGDDVDLDPELAVGRAPVNTVVQAERFVQGILAYDTLNPAPHLASATMLAEVLFPSDWDGTAAINLDGASYGEHFAAALGTHPFPPMVARVYENWLAYPGSTRLTVSSALDVLSSGNQGLLCFIGHGTADDFSVGDGSITLAQLDALANAPDYFLTLAFSSSAAAFTRDCVLGHLVTAPAGGSAGALGFTSEVFPSTGDDYFDEFLENLSASSGVLLGDAMKAVLKSYVPGFPSETLQRWASFGWCLLGDPATPFRTELNPISTQNSSLGGLKARFGRH